MVAEYRSLRPDEELEMIEVEHAILAFPLRTVPDLVLGPDSADIDLIIADGDGKIQIRRVPHGEGIRLVVTIISENTAQADLLATWRNRDPLGRAPLAQVSVERHVYGGNDDLHGTELEG